MAMVLFLLSACKENEDSQSSPVIYMSYFVHHPLGSGQKQDTLDLTPVSGHYVADSIAVGDTVRFDVLLNAVTNILTSFVVQTDTNYLTLRIIPYADLQKALTTESRVDDGLLYFKTGYGQGSVPMMYISKKSGKASVDMKLSSTSVYSPASLSVTQPIR